MPWRLGTSPGAGWVTSFRLRLDSVCMELSVVILTLVEELVDDHKVVAHKVQLIILPVSVPPTLLA